MEIDHPIFIESIQFIRSNLPENDLSFIENSVLERIIHTSGDFGLEALLEFSQDACEIGIKAIKSGSPILTDTNMAAVAIKSMLSKTNNNLLFSAMDWVGENVITSHTRSAFGMEKAWLELSSKYYGERAPIVVFGSSPTALEQLLDILEISEVKPNLIIGMPVGFIGVKKSKERLSRTSLNNIILHSSRGGAAIAAATINSLIRASL